MNFNLDTSWNLLVILIGVLLIKYTVLEERRLCFLHSFIIFIFITFILIILVHEYTAGLKNS